MNRPLKRSASRYAIVNTAHVIYDLFSQKKEDSDTSDEESNTLMIQKTPNRSQRKAVTIKFDDIAIGSDRCVIA